MLRMAIATSVAWEAGTLLGAPHPTFAALAVLFSLQGNPAGALRTAGERLVGVMGGVLVGMLAIHGPGLSAPSVGVLILVALVAGSLPHMSGRPNLQVAVSALLLLAGGGGWRYGVTRLWETALGAVVAVVVSAVLWPVDPVREAEEDLGRLARQLAADLRATPGLFRGSPPTARAHLEAVRSHARQAEDLWLDFPDTVATLRWIPWRDRAAVRQVQARLECLAALYRHARTLVRTGADFAAAPRGAAPAAEPLAAACGALADAVAALGDPERRSQAESLVDGVPDRIDRLVRGGGDPLVVGALASEIGHLAADLREWCKTDPGRAGGA